MFAERAGEAGKVHSFDADDFIFEILQRNIEANGLQGTVVPIFGAVHNVDGETLCFPVQDFKRWPSYASYGIDLQRRSGSGRQNSDDRRPRHHRARELHDVDSHGGDPQAMRGAVKTIARHRMPIIFEYEYHFEDEYKLSFQQ